MLPGSTVEELYASLVADFLNWRTTNIGRRVFKNGIITISAEDLRLGFIQYPIYNDFRNYKLEVPYLARRVVSGEERKRLLGYCRTILTEHNCGVDDIAKRLSEIKEFFELFSEPDNYIKVASGQYTEKAVSIASTQEMTNRAVKTLTDLPEYTAYAKILSERGGRRSTWSGRIATRDFQFEPDLADLGLQEQALKLTRETSCRQRTTVQQEIINRRTAWRKSEPPSTPKGQPSRVPEKFQQEPPSPWTEC